MIDLGTLPGDQVSLASLNSLIDPSLNITLTDARAINNVGQILASGNVNSYLLTPVPEPATWLLCAGGVAAFIGLRGWKAGHQR
jgi:hypothetical protein